MDSHSETPINILLVEDDDVAAELVVRSFSKREERFKVFHVWDGAEALEVLRDLHANIILPKPFIILLDLKMPRMGGLEFLQVLRSEAALRRSVVFVLTTSDREADKTAAYEEHIAGYLLKSAVGEGFSRASLMLDAYSNVVSLPDV